MKKSMPFLALLVLAACTNEPATADAAPKDNAQNKDTMAIMQADSVETKVDTIAETNPIMVLPPPPPSVGPKPAPTTSKKKVDAKSKAKLDSIAIREAGKLPLEQ